MTLWVWQMKLIKKSEEEMRKKNKKIQDMYNTTCNVSVNYTLQSHSINKAALLLCPNYMMLGILININ